MIEILPSVGILDARTRLVELCGEVASSGQPVRLCRRGTPIVELRPLASTRELEPSAAGAHRAGGILDLWKECRQRFGPVDQEFPVAAWSDFPPPPLRP
jgi:antitoxin (DNA-binding transcriptional repressor) of toxin-antitoxin stability system